MCQVKELARVAEKRSCQFQPAMWDVRLCPNRHGGRSFDLVDGSSESSDVLATALRAWVGFELPDDEEMTDRTVEHALDLHAPSASIEETCAWARHYSTRWARAASISRGA